MASDFPHPFPTLTEGLTLSDLGLRAAGVRAGIKVSGAPDVAVLTADKPFAVSGIFTQNQLAAAPVLVSREHLKLNQGYVRAVVVNSGNANACTGEQGLRDARVMCGHVADTIGCKPHEVLVCSTGVIGVPLPIDKVLDGIQRALAEATTDSQAGRNFLRAIMTTDAFPKESSLELGTARFAGICKGAGMIHPNMATLLAFVGTDLPLTPSELSSIIGNVATASFNAVHVDTHPSTNDTLLLMATGTRDKTLDVPVSEIEQSFAKVATRLAWLIARDGEGATKVTTIHVSGASSSQAARAIAERVASSALVRTALFGNDPNWGRFTSQVGNAPEAKDLTKLRCVIQNVVVYEAGGPTRFDKAALSRAMAAEDVSLELQLEDGTGEARLMTSDLGYRYIQVNAEYTT